jgi:trimeric autotransporter adhesin
MKGKRNAAIFAATLLSLTSAAAGHVNAAPPQAAGAEAVRVAAPSEQGNENVPRLVQFSGTLKDSAARPVSGVASVTFAIYADQDGGSALWTETQNVIADANGHYNVLLGGATASGMPAELFGTGQSRWLGVTIARQPEMTRVLLASVPYALKAADADTLGGLPASAYMTTQSFAALSAHATPAKSNTTIVTTSAPAEASASQASAAPASVTQATPTGGGTTNFLPLWTSTTNLGSSKLFQSIGGNIGVGTTSPAVLLDVNGNSIFRGSFQLVPQGTATASTGQLSHSYQWEASTYNSSTKAAVTTAYGFRATPQGNNTANPTSSLDLYYGPGGGTLTDTGLSINNTGLITFVPGQTFPGSSASLNELILPNTTSTTNGVIKVGNAPFIADYASPQNVFVGGYAGGLGAETSAATYNTSLGYESLFGLTTGNTNSAVGSFSLSSNTTADGNSALGYSTLQGDTTGGDNTAVGFYSGATITTGYANTLLGGNADVASGALHYATAIGDNAIVGASNSLVLGGTGNAAVNVGIGTSTPQSTLELSSAASTTYLAPSPIATLTNTAGGSGAAVSLDFNTSAPIYGASYNPDARIVAVDEGTFTDTIAFQANTSGGLDRGLKTTMAIHSNGTVEIYGNLQVDGSLAKNGGSFKIDDPIAPTEKYLYHSFVESPDMMNIYNGNITTDARGYATVEMPAWFEALNGDFRYQLTSVGVFSQAIVAEEIKDGKFRIRTTKPHVKVSWQVTGVRHDAWANAHRIPTEEDKPEDEQGQYMHPELFGQEQGTPKH